MKTTKNDNVTYYGLKDITKIATEAIGDYIDDGYIMNVGTMAGSQGDILKVDLTNGTETIRIRIFKETTDYAFNNDIVLETRHYDCGFKSGGIDSLWNDDGEVIASRKFYTVSGNGRYTKRHEPFYVDDKDIAVHAANVRNARMQKNSQLRYSRKYHTTSIPVNKVIDIIKSRPGYKRTKVEDIDSIYRCGGHYYAELNRCPSKNASTCIKIA